MIHLVFPFSLPPARANALAAFEGQADTQTGTNTGTQAAGPTQLVRDAIVKAGLQRARRTAFRSESADMPGPLAHERWLQTHFNLPGADQGNVLTLTGGRGVAAPAAGRRAWLLRPAHLLLGMDHLVLACGTAGSMVLDNIDAWLELLRDALAPDWTLNAWSADWGETFLRLETSDEMDWLGRSALQANGRSIELYMPQGKHAREWRRFLNHVQMLLHEHPLNEARAARGLVPVNGLWLEGGVPGPLASLRKTTFASALKLAASAASGHGPGDEVWLFDDWLKAPGDEDDMAWRGTWGTFPDFARALRDRIDRSPDKVALAWHFFGESAELSLTSQPADSMKFWRQAVPARW